MGASCVTSDVRGSDLTNFDYTPDIQSTEEAAYTRYQTAVIQFRDDLTNVAAMTVGDTAAYSVTLIGLPSIGELQDFLNTSDVRHRAADTLVVAPVPAFVKVAMTVNLKPGVTLTNEDDIKSAVADAVNGVGFSGKLFVSRVYAAVTGLLPEGSMLSNVSLFARVRGPDGTVVHIRAQDVLTVPDTPETRISARTVQFLCEPQDVDLNTTAMAQED
jgi:hypothetical protein